MSQAGGAALLDAARVAGLDRALREELTGWRKPLAVHDPAKVLLDLAVTLALGGDCLADIAVLRAEPGVYGRVASDPTVSRTIDRLAVDAPWALAAINGARAAVWKLAGAHAPHHEVSAERPLVVDIDATLVTSHSDKQDARPTFKRGYGHHPLWAFADHGQHGTGEPLAVLLRPGNVGSNTAADHITVLREALRQLPGHQSGRRRATRCWSGSTAPARPTRCWTGSPASGCPTPSGSGSPRTPRNSSPCCPEKSGKSPTTATTMSGTARGSPSSRGCWT